MPKPTIGQVNWGDDLNDYLDAEAAKVARVDPGATNTPRQFGVTDGTKVEYYDMPVVDVRHISGGIDLSGTTDMSAELQGAIDEAADYEFGASLSIPFGRIRFESTLSWTYGAMIEGGWGSGDGGGALKARWPYLLWAGDSADNAIEAETLTPPNNWTWCTFRRVLLVSATGFTFKSGIVFPSRVDSTSFTDFQIVGAEDYGIEFQGGGLNVALSDWRTDAIKKASIKWTIGGTDSLTLDRFTTDNQTSGSSVSGGVLYVDGSAAATTARLRLSARGPSKVETNLNLPITKPAHFWFEHNPAATSPPVVIASFDDVWEAKAGAVTRNVGVDFSPDTDRVSLILKNTNLLVEGVPWYANSIVGSSADRQHVLTAIAPFGLQLATTPSTSRQAMEVVGELNVIGSLSHHGKKASPITHMTSTDLSGVTLFPGDLLMDPATRTSGHRVVRECTAQGTMGTLVGITGSGAASQAVLTVNDSSSLKLGQVISIANGGGAYTKRIVGINRNTNEVTCHSNILLESGTAITWSAPTFRNGQFIPITGSKTWDPSSVLSGAMTSTTVTATGAVLGDLATASFSIALPAGCALAAEVTATNTVTVNLINLSGSSQDVGSGTVRVQVRSQ